MAKFLNQKKWKALSYLILSLHRICYPLRVGISSTIVAQTVVDVKKYFSGYGYFTSKHHPVTKSGSQRNRDMAAMKQASNQEGDTQKPGVLRTGCSSQVVTLGELRVSQGSGPGVAACRLPEQQASGREGSGEGGARKEL